MASRNAQLVYQTLVGRGWSPVAASGLVGGFKQESGRELNPTVSHDGGTGFGIAGYRDPTPGQGRWTNLRRFAAANGMDVNDPVTQALFTDHELGGSGVEGIPRYAGPGFGAESRAGATLRGARDIDTAARGAIAYERPQGFSWDNPSAGHGYGNRLSYAREVYGALGGGPVGSVPEPRAASASAPGPTRERAANIDAANAILASEGVQPTSPDVAAATPSSYDLTSIDGWKGALGDQDFKADLTSALKTATGGGAEAVPPPQVQTGSVSAGMDNDFAMRFGNAQALMQTLLGKKMGVA